MRRLRRSDPEGPASAGGGGASQRLVPLSQLHLIVFKISNAFLESLQLVLALMHDVGSTPSLTSRCLGLLEPLGETLSDARRRPLCFSADARSKFADHLFKIRCLAPSLVGVTRSNLPSLFGLLRVRQRGERSLGVLGRNVRRKTEAFEAALSICECKLGSTRNSHYFPLLLGAALVSVQTSLLCLFRSLERSEIDLELRRYPLYLLGCRRLWEAENPSCQTQSAADCHVGTCGRGGAPSTAWPKPQNEQAESKKPDT
ncbi:MAG: hypothetical protein GY719_38920 [bacterium]|nr:hypothetical protein [bacterium]